MKDLLYVFFIALPAALLGFTVWYKAYKEPKKSESKEENNLFI